MSMMFQCLAGIQYHCIMQYVQRNIIKHEITLVSLTSFKLRAVPLYHQEKAVCHQQPHVPLLCPCLSGMENLLTAVINLAKLVVKWLSQVICICINHLAAKQSWRKAREKALNSYCPFNCG